MHMQYRCTTHCSISPREVSGLQCMIMQGVICTGGWVCTFVAADPHSTNEMDITLTTSEITDRCPLPIPTLQKYVVVLTTLW